MYPLYFSAQLKSLDGKLLELGEACLSTAENALDFNSSFVPLLKLGSPAQIVRVLGDQELEYFPGTVYLSTKKLLRLVDIPQAPFSEAQRLFEINTNFPVSLALSPDQSTDFNLEKAFHMKAGIRFLSEHLIKITAFEYIPEGQVLCLSLHVPGEIQLEQLYVRVAERVLLKRSTAVLLCDVLEPSIENRNALRDFTARIYPQIRLL